MQSVPCDRRRGTSFGARLFCLAVLTIASTPLAAQVAWRNADAASPPRLTPAGTAQRIVTILDEAPRRHVILEFADRVDEVDRTRLAAGGVTLLSYLGHDTFFAAVDGEGLDPGRLAGVSSLRGAAALERTHKLHPMLAAGSVPEWAVVAHLKLNSSPDVEPVVGAYVIIHPDVDLREAAILILAHGVVVRDLLESINGLVIEAPITTIPRLADLDVVQWIEPPLPRFSDVNDSNRVITQANTVQAAPYGLDGSGVTALVYDGGTARASHQDFGGRLTTHDGSGLSNHATHTSGTVGGDGSASGGQFRGMAPNATILSFGFQWDGSGIFLYSNPGDIEADYSQAINSLGADVSNNSIGTNTASNGFPCDITGDYGVTAVLIDTIVRGDGSNGLFDAPFRIVWSNGNERGSANCGQSYFSTAPPACAKNHITVGALNSNDDSMTTFSSWGPTDDGRIKPDVSAPGCQSNGEGGVTSTSSASDSAYTVFCGTSMSGPTVCGLTALLLEDYRNQFPALSDPRGSTVKALYAHTAADNGNPGPDYQFGYGSVRIQDAIDLMRSGVFVEETITQGQTDFYQVVIGPGDNELKVTLAWDDVPGTPNVSPSLVNDLDLLVTGPGGTAFPWTLDPGNPGVNAVQSQADHTNNIEQVQITNPQQGTWTVSVTGFDVSGGAQPYSLTGAGAIAQGLFVALPNGTPTLVDPLTPTNINVTITALEESVVGGSAQLFYRFNGGAYQTSPLAPQGGDNFIATLPGAACGELPEFYFSAEGTVSGFVTNPPDAPTTVYSASVGTVGVVFSDDFQTDQGWTAQNLGATSGDWQRGVPVNDPGWEYDPTSDGDGSGSAFLTQNETGNTDVDDGAVRLTSPLIDMSGGNVTISYEYYLRLTNSSSDGLLVEISSNDDAGPWTTLVNHNTDGGLSWRHHEIDQTDLDGAGVTLTSTMRMRFTANDSDPQSINEAGLDGFNVETVSCAAGPTCGNGIPEPGENCSNCPQDVQCAADEDCIAGICVPICGNGIIDPGENCLNCPQDVSCGADEECVGGVCLPLCGNGIADPGENCSTCPQDVQCAPDEVCIAGICQSLCGNGIIDPGENCSTCPQDVSCPPSTECIDGNCEPLCGNGVQDPGENCSNCPPDVPCPPGEECIAAVCVPICGNGVVDPGEDCTNCPQDVQCPPGTECILGICQPLCGNGVVDPGENCSTCPQDVQCPPGTECIAGICEVLCGNGVVDPGEDCTSCPQDVQCPPGTECFNGVCEALCGNGVVDPGEDCTSCPQDVQCPPGTECIGGICEPLCGNDIVDPGEDCITCPQDVQCPPDTECVAGICQPLCGNGKGDPGEDCTNCPQDVQCPPGTECISGACQPLCGNGIGDPGEDCANCPADIQCGKGEVCNNGVCEPAAEPCPWDLDLDGSIAITDLLALLALWGSNPAGPPDFDGNGVVDITDLLALLANWGICP